MPYAKVLLSILVISFAEAAVRLNDYIQHYETLDYDSRTVHQEHHRAKRSLTDPFVRIQFQAHGRHFNLRLKRDTSVFSENLLVDGPAGSIDNFDVSHIYSGTLWGEKDTHAFGSVRDGVFDGKITTPRGSFYVERANKYFSPLHAANFHSVIYSETDMIDPHKDKHAGHAPGCGVADDVKRWMEEVQNSASVEIPKNSSLQNKEVSNDTAKNDDVIGRQIPLAFGLHDLNPHHKYSKEAQRFKFNATDEEAADAGTRVKRAVDMKRRACSLYIQTDPLLWEHIHNKENDEAKTREEIASLIAQHVKAVNIIYEPEDFEGYRGIKFLVQRITINDSKSCNPTNNWANPFCSPNIDVSNFLNLNSQMNHDAFCLAYVFTYRDFTGGTLGLAWVASPQGASGGICEKYKAYTENVGGRHVQTKRSLNTGIITFVNYNSRVPPKVSQLTLAHEIGHNFGSPHDYPPECRPGGQDGNFIMFASATSGDRPNNSKFSVCSKRNITAVLQAVVGRKAGKENCFLEDDGPFCGNHIVEAGEECDCGYNAEECSEKCCYPFEIPPADKEFNPKALPCSRKNKFVCSPSEGPCCTQDCIFEPDKLCREDSDCNHQAKCNGRQAQCPTSTPKQNGTECNKNTQVCTNGECIGSICLKYGLEECFLIRERGVSPEQLCEVACQQRGQLQTCRSTFEQQDENGRNMSGIRLRPGSPCDNFQGYCDVFQKCRAVDAEGPLARLKNLLFNQKTLMTIAQWVTEMWWAVLLIGIAFIIVMAMFIKCCAVHTPSSNPKKPPALRITDTLRRPAQTLRRKRNRHHQTAPHSSTGASSNQAPPPYVAPPRGRPAPSAPAATTGPGGPSRGYGEGRGHYNRPKGGWMPNEPYAAAYPNNRQYFEMTPRDGHV